MTKVTALAAGLVLAAGLAWAGEGEKDKQMRPHADFASMDANGDGSISKEEFVTAETKKIEKRFSMIDENSDGKLTKEELTAARDRMHKMGREERQGKKGDEDDDK